MLLPSIKFNTIVGEAQNIDPSTKNRILIAAPFNRGPADFRYIGSTEEFERVYGNDYSTGSIGFRAAYDQGARQFGAVRILGRGKVAAGELDFRGISTKANNIYLNLKFISEAVQRSKQTIRTDMRVGGTYTSDNSGRYWFKVINENDQDSFVKIAYTFIPLSTTGYIDWTGETQISNSGNTIDPNFPQAIKDAVNTFLDNADPNFDINNVNITAAEFRTWDNTCLEINNLGDTCVDLATEGWLVVLEDNTNRWTVHTNTGGTLIKIDPLNTGVLGTIPRFVGLTPHTFSLTDVETGEEILTDTLNDKNIFVADRNFYVKRNSDQGIPLNVSNGIFLSFDSVNQSSPIDLSVGDSWSIRVDAYRFPIDISESATPYEVCNSVISTISGRNPIGSVILNESGTGILFYLDNSLRGNLGNKFQYFLEIGEIDGEVLTEGSYVGGQNSIFIPVNLAPFVKRGAVVTAKEEGDIYSVVSYTPAGFAPAVQTNVTGILETNTRVERIEVPQINDGTARIVLNKNINSARDSIALFNFSNPDGLIIQPFTKDNIKSMTGGEDGPRFASREFFSINGERLLTVQALYEGSYGNNLDISITPITQGRFELHVVDNPSYNTFSNIEPESFIVDLADTDEDGEINSVKSSVLIKAYFTPKALDPDRYSTSLERVTPMRLSPADLYITNREDSRHVDHYGPIFLRNISLIGGYDGPAPSEVDYIEALSKVKDKPVNYLLTPGLYESNIIKSTLITLAETASVEEGLRMAILNAAPLVTPNNAHLQTIGFNSKDAVMVAGWSTYSNRITSRRFNLSPDVLWAGKRATIPYFVQINAPRSSGFVRSINEVDTAEYISRDSLQVITDARLEVLHREADSFGLKFLNDRTLADGVYEHVTVVLTEKHIRQDVYRMLKSYLREPSFQDTYAEIEARIDNYLGDRKRGGFIREFTSTVVRENPQRRSSISVSFGIVPTPSINEIIINMTLDV